MIGDLSWKEPSSRLRKNKRYFSIIDIIFTASITTKRARGVRKSR